MRYLGIDLGSKTVGLAMSDITGTIASTFKTIFFNDEDYASTIDEIKKIVDEYDIKKIVIGYPLNMNATKGPRVQKTDSFIKKNFVHILEKLLKGLMMQ